MAPPTSTSLFGRWPAQPVPTPSTKRAARAPAKARIAAVFIPSPPWVEVSLWFESEPELLEPRVERIAEAYFTRHSTCQQRRCRTSARSAEDRGRARWGPRALAELGLLRRAGGGRGVRYVPRTPVVRSSNGRNWTAASEAGRGHTDSAPCRLRPAGSTRTRTGRCSQRARPTSRTPPSRRCTRPRAWE